MAHALDGALVLYSQLHGQPELSGQEVHSAARMAASLRRFGFTVEEHVGGHGVVGVLRNGPGETLMIRTELDALPVLEETGSPHASSVRAVDEQGADVPVMHACGHDLHMAAWTATAELMARQRSEWKGTLMMVAQPAEETLSGARAMLADGLFSRFPKPDVAFAIHDHDQLPLGTVGYTLGPYAASADSIDLLVKGRGGHGAYPQATVDPIVIAARIVTALQTIASRESNPLDPVVVSVGSIHGGTRYNVIPDTVKLQLTIRTYGRLTRERVLAAVKRIAEAEATAAGAPSLPELRLSEGAAEAISDPERTRVAVQALARALPQTSFVELPREMGSEDFGEYARAGVPSVMLGLGVVEPRRYAAAKADDKALPALHSGAFLPWMPASLEMAVRVEPPTARRAGRGTACPERQTQLMRPFILSAYLRCGDWRRIAHVSKYV